MEYTNVCGISKWTVDSDKVARFVKNTRNIYVRPTTDEERLRIIEMLENDGYKVQADEITSRDTAIETRFPLHISFIAKEYTHLHSTVCAAAATSQGIIVSEKEFYILYSQYKDEVFEEETKIDDGTVILFGDPNPELTLEIAGRIAKNIKTESDLAAIFADVDNKARWLNADIYDYDERTEEYRKACEIVDKWFSLDDILEEQIFEILSSENVRIPQKGQIEVMIPFMERNGYRDAGGWWIKDN